MKGAIIKIYETKQISNTFKKREFVIDRVEQGNDGKMRVSPIKFQLTQTKCDLLDNYEVGQEVEVQFNINGSKWEREGKTTYFVNLDAWKIEKVGQLEIPTDNPQEEDEMPF